MPVSTRTVSRETALQILYAHAYSRDADPRALTALLVRQGAVRKRGWTGFCRRLVDGVLDEADALDAAIASALEHWRLERLSRVDHLILRLALCEMRRCDEIPLRVTINEYVELAKQYGTDESPAFVNGVLDRLGRGFPHKDTRKGGDFEEAGAPPRDEKNAGDFEEAEAPPRDEKNAGDFEEAEAPPRDEKNAGA